MPNTGKNPKRSSSRGKDHATEIKVGRGATSPADTGTAGTDTPSADPGGRLAPGTEVKVPVAPAPAPVTDSENSVVPPSATPELAELIDTSRLAPGLIARLAKRGIHTVADLRRAQVDGPARSDGLSQQHTGRIEGRQGKWLHRSRPNSTAASSTPAHSASSLRVQGLPIGGEPVGLLGGPPRLRAEAPDECPGGECERDN